MSLGPITMTIKAARTVFWYEKEAGHEYSYAGIFFRALGRQLHLSLIYCPVKDLEFLGTMVNEDLSHWWSANAPRILTLHLGRRATINDARSRRWSRQLLVRGSFRFLRRLQSKWLALMAEYASRRHPRRDLGNTPWDIPELHISWRGQRFRRAVDE